MGNITKIGDAQEDEAAWLEARKSLLTSSELYSWLDDTPAWWSDGPEEVLAGKRGEEKIFDKETWTTIQHGQYDEKNILQKFGYAVGCNVRNENGLYTNSSFPGIGASIDGIGAPWDIDAFHEPNLEEPPVRAEFSQDRTLFPYLRDYIDTTGDQFLTEVKKSLSVKWKKEVPEYYRTQVLTQLAVMEMPYAIIMAETVHRGEEQRWRQFWDMRAYVIERDPAWDRVLLDEGAKFLDALESAC